jgi:TPR repeat protein
MHIKPFVWALVTLCMLCAGCKDFLGKKMNHEQSIDWKTLEFTCKREKDLWPKVDAEADGWFQHARQLERDNREGSEKYIVEYYEKAAAKDHFKAINNLVLIYRDGEGVTPSEKKAVALAERLIKMNVGMGYYHMGTFLEQGIGVKQDRAAALTYFRKAADLGDPQGQFVVGEKLVSDFLQTPMRDKAVALGKQMLECSLSQGHAAAGRELGFHYLIPEHDVKQSLVYFQKAAALGDVDSLFHLYSSFSKGEDGLEKDLQRAQCYEKLSEEAEADKGRTFPDLDKICPLPPKPMPAP